MAFLDGQIWVRSRAVPASVTLIDVVLAVLAAVCALGLIRAAVAIGLPHPYGNEGWNAYHAAAAMAGQGPYPAAGSLFANNYPPLSFYIVGAVGTLTGDFIHAGRLVSFLSFLGVAFAVGKAAVAFGCRRNEALFAAFVFMAFLLFESDYVGVNDPQLLAHGFQMGGLLVLLKAGKQNAALALAAGLMVVGLFTKHNLIALPLSAGIGLLAVDRRRGLVFAGFGIGFALAGTALFQVLAHRALWQVLGSPRVWSLDFALNGFFGRLPELILPAAGTILLVRRCPDANVCFAAAYFALSLVLAFLFFGGAGCSNNMLFDGFIALALCGGLALNRTQARRRALMAVLWGGAVGGMLLFHAATDSFKPRHWLNPRAPEVADTADDVAFLKAAKGPLLVKDLALSYWAGKPASVDLWSYEQAVATGARDGHELSDAIAARRYGVLQLGVSPNALDAPPEIRRDYVAAMNAVIVAHYRIDHRDANGTFWVPKR